VNPFQALTEREEKSSLAAAVADRLTFRAHIIETGTQSHRLRAARANKPSRPPKSQEPSP
jgi:hypothetical protein